MKPTRADYRSYADWLQHLKDLDALKPKQEEKVLYFPDSHLREIKAEELEKNAENFYQRHPLGRYDRFTGKEDSLVIPIVTCAVILGLTILIFGIKHLNWFNW